MPKTNHQKAKLLALLRLLFYESDERHPLSGPRLVQMLRAQGIAAERKSVYDDLEVLRGRGYDIQLERGRGYFLGGRLFQLAELKLLVDAVQSSKFITGRKSAELISKLEQLTSRAQASGLQRQVFVAGRVKSMNESVYYNIDAIHEAIGENRQITFSYFRYNVRREKELRHNGRLYRVSPYALLRSDENYYLIAYDSRSGEIRHYRVDKMSGIGRTERPRDGMEAYRTFDLARYAQLQFGMFRGPEQTVTLRCRDEMADVIIDRFGKEIALVPEEEGWFTCAVNVMVSPQFYGWLFGLGGGVQLTAPRSAVEGMRRQLGAAAALYGPQGAGESGG